MVRNNLVSVVFTFWNEINLLNIVLKSENFYVVTR